jgi:hypothetical protein
MSQRSDRRLSSFVGAALELDLARMDDIVRATPADDPHRRCCEVVAESCRVGDGPEQARQESLANLLGLLDPPPRDAELFLLVLTRIVQGAIWVGRTAEAARALRLADRIGDAPNARPEMEAAVLLSGSRLHSENDNPGAARQCLDRALEVLGARRGQVWLACKMARVYNARHLEDCDSAESDLADVGNTPLEKISRTSVELERALNLTCAGRFAEALAAIEASPAEATVRGRRVALLVRIDMLLRLGRLE